MEFLEVLLSDKPCLPDETRFYQRLLAMDLEEATELAEEFLKGKSLEQLFDGLLVPALKLAEEDRHRGRLDDQHEEFIMQNTRLLIDDLCERADELSADEKREPGSTPAESKRPAPLPADC